MMVLALMLAAAAGPSGAIGGDFDRDGRPDRIRLERKGDVYRVMLYRSTGEVVPVEMNVPVTDDFKFNKVSRENRAAVCQHASLSRYVCDSGDVIQYGSPTQSAMAVWNGQRFIVYRPPVGQSPAAQPGVASGGATATAQ
jgi:hypothetical protein